MGERSMHRVRFGRVLAAGLCLGAAGLLTAGCVQAEKTRYMRHLTTLARSGPPTNEQIAIAFGLDGRGEPPAALAAVADGKETVAEP